MAICLASLIRPRIGMYGYLWYDLMRPDVLAFVEDSENIYSFLIAVFLLISMVLRFMDLFNVFRNPFSLSILLLQIPIALSVWFAVEPLLSYPRYNFYIRMIVIVVLIPAVVFTERHLPTLMLVITLSLGVVAVKYGLFGVVYGGVELVKGYGPILADSNFVALAMATVIPLCWYSLPLVPFKWMKPLLIFMIAMAIAGVIMTNSRGSSIAMAVGILLILMRTKQRVALLMMVLAFFGGTMMLVREMFVARISTLANYEEEASAASRIWHAKAALAMTADYPLFGVGFGGMNYAALSTSYSSQVSGLHVVHNSYLQMLVDSGIIAFLLYTGVLIYGIVWTGRTAKHLQETSPQTSSIARGIQIALVVFAVGSTFYSCQRMDLVYIYLMCAGSLYMALKLQPGAVPVQTVPLKPVPQRLAQVPAPTSRLKRTSVLETRKPR
jgi:probable O-glycosylation ligase (exosortase A-associated)